MTEELTISQSAYISLGTNLGDRMKNLMTALRELESCAGIELEDVSSIYETDPVGGEAGGKFLNAACSVRTGLKPRALLDLLEVIELKMGRTGKRECKPRVIDLDLLLHGDRRLREKGLVLPHPRLHERGFVLVPLCEIAPQAVHPVLEKRICDILLDLGEVEGVRFYSRFPQKELVQG